MGHIVDLSIWSRPSQVIHTLFENGQAKLGQHYIYPHATTDWTLWYQQVPTPYIASQISLLPQLQ